MCEGTPVLGLPKNKKKAVSCGIDMEKLVGITPIEFPRGRERLTYSDSDTLAEPRISKLFRRLLAGEEGMMAVAEMISRGEDPVGETRVFEENIEEELIAHPNQLSMGELLLLVALPSFAILCHTIHKLLSMTACCDKMSRTSIGNMLLAMGDFLLESITTVFFWIRVPEQQKWEYQGCMELPVLSDFIAADVSTLEMLVTHCTHVKLKPDWAAAVISSTGTALSLSLLFLELWQLLSARRNKGDHELLAVTEEEGELNEEELHCGEADNHVVD